MKNLIKIIKNEVRAVVSQVKCFECYDIPNEIVVRELRCSQQKLVHLVEIPINRNISGFSEEIERSSWIRIF